MTTTYASATKGSEVRVPAEHEDGSPTNASCYGTVSDIVWPFAKVEWVSDGGGASWFRIADLSARCWVCKRDLDGSHDNGRHHRECGKRADRQEREDRQEMAEDIEQTDRAFPRSPGSFTGMQPRRHSYDPDAERGDYP